MMKLMLLGRVEARVLLMPDHYFLFNILNYFHMFADMGGVPEQPHSHKETPLSDIFSVNPYRTLTLDASARFIHNIFSTYM
jgi:hypothetical protein